jgi:hypothetical protein
MRHLSYYLSSNVVVAADVAAADVGYDVDVGGIVDGVAVRCYCHSEKTPAPPHCSSNMPNLYE